MVNSLGIGQFGEPSDKVCRVACLPLNEPWSQFDSMQNESCSRKHWDPNRFTDETWKPDCCFAGCFFVVAASSTEERVSE